MGRSSTALLGACVSTCESELLCSFGASASGGGVSGGGGSSGGGDPFATDRVALLGVDGLLTAVSDVVGWGAVVRGDLRDDRADIGGTRGFSMDTGALLPLLDTMLMVKSRHAGMRSGTHLLLQRDKGVNPPHPSVSYSDHNKIQNPEQKQVHS
jgi:hypothetical protein